MTKEEFYSRALSFDEVGEQVDIFKKEKIKYEQEIERLNNIIKEQGLEDKSNYYVKGLEGSLKEYQDEVKRLNNIINELEKSWKDEIIRLNNFIQEDSSMIEINNIRKMLIQEREKDLYKLQELKGSDKE